jgi:uncharacterized protein
MNEEKTIIWRRLDIPGHEFARASVNETGVFIEGTAILVYESAFCKLDYAIRCDSDWRTRKAKVSGFVGAKEIAIEISVDAEKNWRLNDEKISEVDGCIDIDLNFSPVTNTLPIRRLNLTVGERATVRAAWLRFPSFRLEPLEQVYERTAPTIYHYESAGGRFTTEIDVDDFGLAVNYLNIWEIENGKS